MKRSEYAVNNDNQVKCILDAIAIAVVLIINILVVIALTHAFVFLGRPDFVNGYFIAIAHGIVMLVFVRWSNYGN